MSDRPAHANRAVHSVPAWIPWSAPLVKGLLASGIRLGPNGLITIRGRTSGLPRTNPVSIIEVSGRRWIWAPWGDVQWVRNLRAAGRATITKRRRTEEVTATELDATERLGFFRDVYCPLIRSHRFAPTFIRLVDGVDVNDPMDAAEGRHVFELHPV